MTALSSASMQVSLDQPNKGRTIHVTSKNYRSIKSAYDQAVSVEDKQFIWSGFVLETAYARYMLIYMRDALGIQEECDGPTV